MSSPFAFFVGFTQIDFDEELMAYGAPKNVKTVQWDWPPRDVPNGKSSTGAALIRMATPIWPSMFWISSVTREAFEGISCSGRRARQATNNSKPVDMTGRPK